MLSWHRFSTQPLASALAQGLLEKMSQQRVVFLELRRHSRVTTGDYRLPLVSALGSPIFYSSGEGKLGGALESLQGQRYLIYACVQDLMLLSREDRDHGFPFQTPPGGQDSPGGEAKTPLSSRVATGI